MEAVKIIFNVVVVVFIVSTMFGAGLGTTLPALKSMFTNVKLWVVVLVANVLLVPLLGWGVSALGRNRKCREYGRSGARRTWRN